MTAIGHALKCVRTHPWRQLYLSRSNRILQIDIVATPSFSRIKKNFNEIFSHRESVPFFFSFFFFFFIRAARFPVKLYSLRALSYLFQSKCNEEGARTSSVGSILTDTRLKIFIKRNIFFLYKKNNRIIKLISLLSIISY